MTDQSSVAIVVSIYDAFRRGDIAAIINLLDDHAELVFEGSSSIPWSGNREGRDGWGSFFQLVGENLDDIKLTMAPFAAEGDRVVAAGRYQALVRRTGKRIDSPLVHLWTVRNQKVVRCQELTNTAAEAAACAS